MAIESMAAARMPLVSANPTLAMHFEGEGAGGVEQSACVLRLRLVASQRRGGESGKKTHKLSLLV